MGEEIERQLRHRRPPKLAQNGFEHGTDLAAGFRPQFWGRIPANVMNYYWRPDSGRQMAAGIWPPNGGQNPARGLARVPLFSGTTGASRHAHSSAHMRFGSALHIFFSSPHVGGSARSKLVCFRTSASAGGFAAFGRFLTSFSNGWLKGQSRSMQALPTKPY